MNRHTLRFTTLVSPDKTMFSKPARWPFRHIQSVSSNGSEPHG
jgi:hypothetical protein